MRKFVFLTGLFFVLPVKAFFSLGSECPLEQPIMWTDNKCYACEEARTLIVNSSEEQRNSNFIVMKALNELENFCKCPADKPVMDFQGGCNACDVPGDILLGSGCEKCPQRKQSGSWQINDITGRMCVLK
ncbi:MAG: hypothetical protein IKV03_04050 [Alphaproteobacteria bacterium]|nr:hypothetical protein [Alphaproteobacteria bacterium]